jgi:protein-tyrosine phosphatase
MLQLLDPRKIEASRITPRLYQGSRPPTGNRVANAGFDTLVLCAEEFQPPDNQFHGVQIIRCPIDDTFVVKDDTWLPAVRAATAVCVSLRRGAKVLTTCQAGRNRSGLVNALTLHMLTGMSGTDAVQLIQSRRPAALTNFGFVRALERLQPAQEMAHAKRGRR